eukprot:gene62-3457_t
MGDFAVIGRFATNIFPSNKYNTTSTSASTSSSTSRSGVGGWFAFCGCEVCLPSARCQEDNLQYH